MVLKTTINTQLLLPLQLLRKVMEEYILFPVALIFICLLFFLSLNNGIEELFGNQ